jgi:cyclohexa-1,5-dienecarbonyl-CoA hydratase
MSARVHARRLAVDHVLHLLIDHPKGNILSLVVMQQLRAALAEARDDRGLRCVLLQGAGGNFSFGASVEEHRRAQAPAMLAGFHALIRDIADFPVPVVAVVEGRCLGGAFEVLLACHFVLATPNAQVGCPEIRLGVFPPVLAALGPLRLGMALTERLMLSGDTVGRDALERCGVLTGLLPEAAGEDITTAATTWYTHTLGNLSAFALRQTVLAARSHPLWRQSLGEALDALERQYVEQVVTSHDGNEGIEAFLARRSPLWTDA